MDCFNKVLVLTKKSRFTSLLIPVNKLIIGYILSIFASL